MNPLYDLVVIGLIVVIVFVNLYFSWKTSKVRTTFFSDFVPKYKITTNLRPDPVHPSHGLSNILPD